MRYESLLARRYMRAQKRQSAFTLVSIAVAIAVMTMLFVIYGVFMENAKESIYRYEPYHVVFYNWPENKATALRNEEQINSVYFERVREGTLEARIMLKDGIDNVNAWARDVQEKHGVPDWLSQNNRIDENPGRNASLNYAINTHLLVLDGIGSDAIVKRFLFFWLYLIFVLLFALILRMVVDTAFEISAKERERHYGVLQSIGATPRQIVGIITREGLRLCVLAIPIGLALGVLCAFGMFRAILAAGLAELLVSAGDSGFEIHFLVPPGMLLVSAVVGTLWTFLSAYGVGMRVVRKMPMDAITARVEQVTKIKRRTLFGLLFGLPGRIASRNARRQKKRFRMTVLTLTVSIVLFAIFSALADSVEFFIAEKIGEAYGGDWSFNIVLKEDPAAGKTVWDAVDALNESELFRDIEWELYGFLETEYPYENSESEGHNHLVGVSFLGQEQYRSMFGEHPPVSYEALAESDGLVYVPKKSGAEPEEKWEADLRADVEAGKLRLKTRESMTGCEALNLEFPVCAVPDMESESFYRLFGTVETYVEHYAEWFGDTSVYVVAIVGRIGECSNAKYQQILSFFRAHTDLMEYEWDNCSEVLSVQNMLAALRAGVLFLNCILALAALINLLNIISTGIANRRSELASLQCVGMTDGQLLRMTLVECLQYVLKACLIAAAFCALLSFAYNRIILPSIVETMDSVGPIDIDRELALLRLDVGGIFARLIPAAAVALFAGCVDSVLMLRAQSRQSLSERIRGAE